MSRISSLLAVLFAIPVFAVGQTAKIPPPKVDHHMHIWSLQASELVTDPVPPEVKLPAAFDQLLRDKEKFGGKTKDAAALRNLYLDDALVSDAGANLWLRGKPAVDYIVNSTTMNHLVPTNFQELPSSGYIAGYEAVGKTPVSSFLYVLQKGADGKWRISAETFTMEGQKMPHEASLDPLIAELDEAGIEKGVILSTAYWFGSPARKVENEQARLAAENDWVAQQVARYPDRLVGFFSVAPLSDYAVDEIERCAKNPHLVGLKLHFGNSRVDVLNPDHVAKCRKVFAAANRLHLPIVVHLWTLGDYGPKQAKAFLENILPAAPDVPVQIAHLSASGPGYHSDDALEVYANAAVAGDPRMKNVYFDVASMVLESTPQETLDLVAKRIRQLGVKRILFGSDRSANGNEPPKKAWAAFLRLPLTEEEFRTISGNVAPYVGGGGKS